MMGYVCATQPHHRFSFIETATALRALQAFVPSDGEVVWEAPAPDAGSGKQAAFGRGRPGWHIECSAMCNKLLGRFVLVSAFLRALF